ncbi:MAG: Trm112 family protein, partial [Pseudomonadota bacterium]
NYDPSRHELISKPAQLAYPIRNGIPVLLVDEARVLDD